jgi:hypothetical protein
MYRSDYAKFISWLFSSNSSDKQYPKLLWKVIKAKTGDSERKVADTDVIHNY